MYASHYNNENAVRALIQCGADPLLRNNRGTTVLGFMAKQGQLAMAKITQQALQSLEDKIKYVNMGTYNSE